MKSLLVLCLVFVAVYGLPAKQDSYDDSDESFFLFPARPHKKQVPSVIEVEVGDSGEDTSFFPSYFRPFFINPFSFMNFGFSDFFSRPSWLESLAPKGIPEAAVKNSTSSTKVVDGHKITVNETTYENENNGAIYRFQVIEVSPVDSKEKEDKPLEERGGEEEEEDTADKVAKEPETKVETTEEVKPDLNSQDNEIRKEEVLASYELQGDDPSVYDKNVEMISVGDKQTEKRENLVDLRSGPTVDLSGDTRVNKLLAENARRGGLFMIPPEVEVFDNLDYDYLAGNYQQQEIINPSLNQEVIRPQFQTQHQI